MRPSKRFSTTPAMAAMADLGDGPYKTGDVAGRLGGRASSSSVHRDSLIKKGPDL